MNAYPFLARKAMRRASALSLSTAGSCTKWSGYGRKKRQNYANCSISLSYNEIMLEPIVIIPPMLRTGELQQAGGAPGMCWLVAV